MGSLWFFFFYFYYFMGIEDWIVFFFRVNIMKS